MDNRPRIGRLLRITEGGEFTSALLGSFHPALTVVDELTEEQAKSVMVPLPETDEQRAAVAIIDAEARRFVSLRSKAVASKTAGR